MSIRRYLVLVLVSLLTLVTFMAAIQGYKASMSKASALFDAELSSFATTITDALPVEEAKVSVVNSGKLAFQIWHNQHLIVRSHNAPENALFRAVNGVFSLGFSEANFLGKRWRVYTQAIDEKGHWVMVAQPLQQRFALAEEIILSAVTPIIVAIPFLALVISIIIRQGLSPLTRLTHLLSVKKVNDLTPIRHRSTNKNELTPVVRTLNQLFERLSSAFEREKHFASDAAHELRTPLSVLKLNVHNLENQITQQYLQHASLENDEVASKLLSQLNQSVDRMAHVVDQILVLNRTNPEQILVNHTQIDFYALTQRVIQELYPEIAMRNQDIALHGDKSIIEGSEFALGVLIQNLISNASKYTPDYGEVSVTITETIVANEKSLRLQVEDSGPGIALSEYQRIFDRFYRVGGDKHNTSVVGCGLGLAIVKHITELHQASITLGKSEKFGGLLVEVVFPLALGEQNV